MHLILTIGVMHTIGIALMHLKCHKSHIPEGWLRLLVRRIGGAHAGRLGAPAVRGPAVQAP